MMSGTMQSFALTLNKFLDHAAKWHPRGKVVTATADNKSDKSCYAEVKTRALKVSDVLADLGVVSQQHVATLAWNTQAHLEVWYGIMGMGAVCHTLNPRLPPQQLASMLNQSKAKVLLASADLASLAAEIISHAQYVEHILFIDAGEQGLKEQGKVLLEDLIGAAEGKAVWGEFDENYASGLCFTSGTTGNPKGVSYTHRSSYLHALRLLQADVLGFTAQDTVMPVVPMFHANAWGLPFATSAVGAGLVLPGRQADGESLAKLIASEEVSVAVGVPTIWVGLMDYVEQVNLKLPSLKRIIVGGAPMPTALAERIHSRLGASVQTSWGMTELSPSGTFSPLSDLEKRSGASGRPGLGVDLLLTDTNGTVLPEQRNVEGHLRAKGAAVIERYYGHDEDAVDANGWFDTGDLARIDDDGNLYITGRSKELIKSGGEWINPTEIEAAVNTFPGVSHAAVIGCADPKWGERPVLFVEISEQGTVDNDKLQEIIRSKVASWWVPDVIVQIPQMPLAATGKIDKRRLKREYG